MLFRKYYKWFRNSFCVKFLYNNIYKLFTGAIMSLMAQKLEEIAKLNELKERGVITETEFETQKQRLLGQYSQSPTCAVASIGLVDAYKRFWKKSFVLKGRATIPECWYPVLVNFLIYSFLYFISAFADFLSVLAVLFCIVASVPTAAVLVRRIHDAGHSAKFLLVPAIYLIVTVGVALVMSIVSATGGDVSGIRSVMFVALGFIGFFLCLGFGIATLVFAMMPTELKENKYGKL